MPAANHVCRHGAAKLQDAVRGACVVQERVVRVPGGPITTAMSWGIARLEGCTRPPVVRAMVWTRGL